jgi:threonine dehydrogenase-like Zn-dependent dehydrogenase
MRRRDLIDKRALIAFAVIALVGGAIALALADGTVVMVIGAGLIGLAAIALVSLAFLLIGQSEERDRRRNPRG